MNVEQVSEVAALDLSDEADARHEAQVAWDTARALDGCLTDIRKVALEALARQDHGRCSHCGRGELRALLAADLARIVRLIGDPAE